MILSLISISTTFITSYCLLDEMQNRTDVRLSRKVYGICLIIGAIFVGFIGTFIYPLCKIVALMIWNIIIGKFVFAHKGTILLYDVFFAICIGVCEFPMLLLFTVIIANITMATQAILWMNLLLMLSSQLFILYFYHIYSRYRFQQSIKLSKSYILLNFVFLPIFSLGNIFLLIQTLQFYLYPVLTVFIVLDILFIIYLNVYLSYTLQSIINNAKMKEELNLYAQESRLQYAYYQKLEEKYEESRKLIHDIKRHMNMVDLAKHDHDLLQNYENDLRSYIDTLTIPVLSTNRMLNIILNEKKAEAVKAQIAFDCQISAVSIDFIKEIDMTTIFSNLLDNAIDACKQLEGHKVITLRADKIQDFLVMNIKNTTNTKPLKDFKSTKQNHDGLGLKNVAKTLEKYGGNIQVQFDDMLFTVHLYIPIA